MDAKKVGLFSFAARAREVKGGEGGIRRESRELADERRSEQDIVERAAERPRE